MIALTSFNKSETKLIHLANLWNYAEELLPSTTFFCFQPT